MNLKQRANVLEDRIADFSIIFTASQHADLVDPLDPMLLLPELQAEVHPDEPLQDNYHRVLLLEVAIEVIHLETVREDVRPHILENPQLLPQDAANLLALDHHLHRLKLVQRHASEDSCVVTIGTRKTVRSHGMIIRVVRRVFANC